MTANDFVFSTRFRFIRHVIYWACYLPVWACYWTMVWSTFSDNLLRLTLYLPQFIIFSYPVAYLAVPKLLLKNRYFLFILSIVAWGIFGWYFCIFFRSSILFPVVDWLNIEEYRVAANPASYLCMTTTAGCMIITSLTKRWLQKKHELADAEKEKISAEIQLLKAQLHPHFLFNTLNNIYSFALDSSPKTPQMILKLSTLLSYMLYECKTEEVLLEKEVDVMNDYIDLEKERYGDKLDISINMEGDIRDKYIAPLLMIPILENAFKHGTSEQLERPWMSIDISVKDYTLKCKIINSKNESVLFSENGVGINNVRKRLEILYPGKHDLKLSDEGGFFVASMTILLNYSPTYAADISFVPQLQTAYS